MKVLFHIVIAYMMRNLHKIRSYRFSWVMGWIMMTFNLLILYFVAQMIKNSELLKITQGNYFSYLILGMIPMMVLGTSMGAMMGDIRSGQMTGTLENLLASPVRLPHLLIASAINSFFFTFIRIVLTLILGALLFDIPIFDMNIPAVLLTLVLTATAFSGLGIISSAFILAFKRGDPVRFLVSTTFVFCGGVFFPVDLLPSVFQVLSKCIPITYAATSMRKAFIPEISLTAMSTEYIFLLLFAGVTLPISIVIFNWALAKARKDGSLAQY